MTAIAVTATASSIGLGVVDVQIYPENRWDRRDRKGDGGAITASRSSAMVTFVFVRA